MWRFSTIYHEVRKHFNLSLLDYCIIDMISQMSSNPNASIQGWCNASNKKISEMMDCSRRKVISVLEKAEQLGLIEQKELNGTDIKLKRATSLWHSSVYEYKSTKTPPREQNAQGVQKMHRVCKKVTPPREQNAHDPVNKVHTDIYINSNKDNNIGDFSENHPSIALFDAKEGKEEQTPSPFHPPPIEKNKTKRTRIGESFLVELNAIQQCKKNLGDIFPNCDFQHYIDEVRDWIESTAPNKTYVDWWAMFRGWIRRDLKKNNSYKTINNTYAKTSNNNQSIASVARTVLQQKLIEIEQMDEPPF